MFLNIHFYRNKSLFVYLKKHFFNDEESYPQKTKFVYINKKLTEDEGKTKFLSTGGI